MSETKLSRKPNETAQEEWDRSGQITCPKDGTKMDCRSGWGEVVFVCPVCGHREEMT